MNREALHESLSAVMDNEADELELCRVLASSHKSEARGIWMRYQVARAAMHKELASVDLCLDISSAVSAAIAAEKTLVAPAVAPTKKGFSLRSVGRIAVAASVTVAVLAGVRLYNQNDAMTNTLATQQAAQPTLNVPQSQVQAPTVTVGYSAGTMDEQQPQAEQADKWHYVQQHIQHAAGGSASDSVSGLQK